MSLRTTSRRKSKSRDQAQTKNMINGIAGLVVLAGICYLVSIPLLSRQNQNDETEDKARSDNSFVPTHISPIRYPDKPLFVATSGSSLPRME